MVIETFKIKLLNEAFNIAGMMIAGYITKPDYEAKEKLMEEHFTELRRLARDEEKDKKRELRYIEEPEEEQTVVVSKQDLTPKKIIGGTACLPCSRDHFTTTSAILKEAVNFAKRPNHGLRHDEVVNRIDFALEQLLAMERWDLSPDYTHNLTGKEKELADWALNNSAELRHQITNVKSIEDLENVAVKASEIKSSFMRSVWDLATADGTIEKLCKGLKDEERERCIQTINTVLKEKKPATG